MSMTAEKIAYRYENQIIERLEEVKDAYDPSEESDLELLQKAIRLVRLDSIQHLTFDETTNMISAWFDNAHVSQLTISLETTYTKCTCFDDECIHEIALLFYLHMQFYSLTEWMTDWRKKENELLQLTINSRTPEAWNATLKKLVEPLRKTDPSENPSLFVHKYSLISQKASPLYPFEWEWRPLFDLFYRLHCLRAAWPYVTSHLDQSEQSFAYGKWYVKNWLMEQLNRLEDSLESLSSKRRLFETDPFYDDLKTQVRDFTLEFEGLFNERFRVYRNFWQILFTDQLSQEKEWQLLNDYNTPEAYYLQTYFYILHGQYDELEQMDLQIGPENLKGWLPLAEMADYEDDTRALSILLHAMLPHIGPYFEQFIPRNEQTSFARKMDGLLESAEIDETIREGLFTVYGPAGVDVFTDFLIERERYREWAALIHRYRVSYEVAEASGLKLGMKDDPASMLPLLHTYAIQFIEEKNRQSYRRAGRIFKKMKTCAKKCGKTDFWNDYTTLIHEKYRRLRALMEEMEKGNLRL